MSGSRIASRYARSLYRLSEGNAKGALQSLEALKSIGELFKIDQSARVMRSPVMPADLKQSLVDAAIAKANGSSAIKNFCTVVIAAGRVNLFPQIIDIFQELIDESEGRIHAQVKTAVELGSGELDEIKSTLSSAFKKKVEVVQVVDATLLGGFVVRVGNMLLDYSVRTKLDALAQNAVH